VLNVFFAERCQMNLQNKGSSKLKGPGIFGLIPSDPNTSEIRCPKCNSDAVYKYGRTHAGRQRYLCLQCNRQFAAVARRYHLQMKRPVCPHCGKPMHVYMRQPGLVRFRCRGYPECRTFLAIREEDNKQT
jgi:DNA-directed RNA polymerase subunit RPC12/RpoP